MLINREKLLRINNSSTLTNVNNLSLVFYRQQRYEKARKIFSYVLKESEKMLKINHFETLTSIYTLNAALCRQRTNKKSEIAL